MPKRDNHPRHSKKKNTHTHNPPRNGIRTPRRSAVAVTRMDPAEQRAAHRQCAGVLFVLAVLRPRLQQPDSQNAVAVPAAAAHRRRARGAAAPGGAAAATASVRGAAEHEGHRVRGCHCARARPLDHPQADAALAAGDAPAGNVLCRGREHLHGAVSA